MVPKTHWSIQDYLKQAGMAVDGMRRKTAAAPPDDAKQDFSRILADSQANAQQTASIAGGGRRIADYLKTPVVAKVPRPRNPISPSVPGADQTTAPACPPPSEQRTLTEVQPLPRTSAETQIKSSSSSSGLMSRQPDKADKVTQRIDQSIEKAAADYDLPAELIRGVIQAESNFQVRAVSPAGAQGLMQLMPATARELGVEDPFDIQENIDGGARYLRQMLDMFGGDLKQALSAYNAGPGTVMKYDGQVPYPETRHYVRKVMLYAQR